MQYSQTLMLVHAHPDDETFSTGGTIALYHERGVRVVNVTCTGGEEGEIVDPELDTPENHRDLATIRAAELAMAGHILGVTDQEYLGYGDSGMAGRPSNANSSSFHQASLDEASARLVRLIRRYQPQVLVSYDEQGSYGHPDHIKAHQITVAAFAAAGDEKAYPDTGAPWQPSKLYFVGQPRTRMLASWQTRKALGQATPLDNPDFDPNARGIADERVTTELDVAPYVDRKIEALRAHRTQVKQDHTYLLGDDLARDYMSKEFFILAAGTGGTAGREHDLFAGIATDEPVRT